MNKFTQKILHGQINRTTKRKMITNKSLERMFNNLATVSKFDKSQSLGYTIAMIIGSLITFSLMTLALYVLVTIFNTLGIWFVLGAIVSWAWLKNGIYLIGYFLD